MSELNDFSFRLSAGRHLVFWYRNSRRLITHLCDPISHEFHSQKPHGGLNINIKNVIVRRLPSRFGDNHLRAEIVEFVPKFFRLQVTLGGHQLLTITRGGYLSRLSWTSMAGGAMFVLVNAVRSISIRRTLNFRTARRRPRRCRHLSTIQST